MFISYARNPNLLINYLRRKMSKYPKFFQFKITQEMYDWMAKQAEKDERSMGSVGRMLIKNAMEKDEKN